MLSEPEDRNLLLLQVGGKSLCGSRQYGDIMALPQTLPGIPTPGIDPTPDELSSISQVAHVFAWLGTNSNVVEALSAELGGSPKLRDLVYVSQADWSAIIDDLNPEEVVGIRENHLDATGAGIERVLDQLANKAAPLCELANEGVESIISREAGHEQTYR